MDEKERLCQVRKDLVGMVFGRLTVLERADDCLKPKKNGKYEKCACWKCRCECGNIVVVKGSNLKSKQTQSCGCLHKETAKNQGKRNGIDLAGKKFGKLTVIKRVDDYISPQNIKVPRWLCLCECGNETVTTYSKLKSGETTSCGCVRYEDVSGQRFGKLVAIERVDKEKNSKAQRRPSAYWLCECDCGNMTVVELSNLKRGMTKSCGCTKSFNEAKICEILTKNEIKHIKEFRFSETKIKNFRFDFAIFSNEKLIGLIEFDGEHHYRPVKYGGCTVEEAIKQHKQQQIRDKQKNDFCQKNSIPLLRIPYWEEKEIELILKNFLLGLKLNFRRENE